MRIPPQLGTSTGATMPPGCSEDSSSADPTRSYIPVPRDKAQTSLSENKRARRCIWCVGCRSATPVLTPCVPESRPDLSLPAAFAIQVEKQERKQTADAVHADDKKIHFLASVLYSQTRATRLKAKTSLVRPQLSQQGMP